jgi:hypothetical protein
LTTGIVFNIQGQFCLTIIDVICWKCLMVTWKKEQKENCEREYNGRSSDTRFFLDGKQAMVLYSCHW